MFILYYSSLQQIYIIIKFSIHHTTFTKHFSSSKNAKYYIGKYIFYREPFLTAKIKDINDLDFFFFIYKKDRLKFNRSKALASSAKSVISRFFYISKRS